uniref:Tetraspanin n=1 Tax=Anabas testudineus TaxID=64144 RepID=A0A7N6FJ61_ANATE
MGKINGCLKCLFVFFNVLFAIVGCLLIYGSIKSTAHSQQMSAFGGPSLGWSWVVAIGVLGISCLGIYAGLSEKPIALKIFAGFMGIGMVIMMIFGIITVVTRNKVKDNFQTIAADVAKSIKEDKDLKGMLEALQASAQCCGVVKPEDWGNEIPDSCECKTTYMGVCRSKPQGMNGPTQIYKKACSDFILDVLNLVFSLAMGLFFAFAVTAVS